MVEEDLEEDLEEDPDEDPKEEPKEDPEEDGVVPTTDDDHFEYDSIGFDRIEGSKIGLNSLNTTWGHTMIGTMMMMVQHGHSFIYLYFVIFPSRVI